MNNYDTGGVNVIISHLSAAVSYSNTPKAQKQKYTPACVNWDVFDAGNALHHSFRLTAPCLYLLLFSVADSQIDQCRAHLKAHSRGRTKLKTNSAVKLCVWTRLKTLMVFSALDEAHEGSDVIKDEGFPLCDNLMTQKW